MMKTFTLYFFLLGLALGAGAQARNHNYRTLVENQEALNAVAGERVTEAALRMFSLDMRLPLGSTAQKAVTPTTTLDSIIETLREPGTQPWENHWKTRFQYDASLKLTVMIDETWNADLSRWAPEGKTELFYDEAGRIIQMLIHSSANYGEAPALESRMNVYYDDAQRVDSMLFYEAVGEDSWLLNLRQFYTYGSDGLLEQIDMLAFDEEEEEWMEGMAIKFTYDDADRRTSYGMYISDEDSGEEFLYTLTEYTYNEQGQLALTEHSAMSFVSFQMEPDYKTEYTYNESGDRTMSVDYDWVDGSWEEDYKQEFTYDPDLNFDDVVNPYRMFSIMYEVMEAEFQYNRAVIATEGYESIDGEFVWTDQSAYFYSGETTTGIADVPDVDAGIYPNPARERIALEWNGSQASLTLEMYQVTGARVLHMEVTPNAPVSIGHLNKGLYLYRLIDNGRVVHAGKLVKQ